MQAITIGADPEFFITTNDGKILPIIGLLGGTKDEPIKVDGSREGFAVQEDNVMAEYNIPPTTDAYTFAAYVQEGRNHAMRAIRTRRKGVDVSTQCSHELPHKLLQHPQAQTFGCSPDFDAYQQGRPLPRISPRALATDNGAWRFAGGHVHLGYSKDTFGWEPPPFVLAAFCDVFLGIPALAYGMDNQGERRKHYGTPGRYRPTKYGIEYRTLGNGWTMSERHSASVGMMAQRLAQEFAKGEDRIRQLYNDLPWVDIRKTISAGDWEQASLIRNHCRQLKMEVM